MKHVVPDRPRRTMNPSPDSTFHDSILKEFLVESWELLGRLERDLIVLEQAPAPAVIASLFRGFHTIKGNCGMMGLRRLETLSHAAESLLGALRDGRLAPNREITTALLAACDGVRQILSGLEQSSREAEGTDAGLIAALQRLQTEPPTPLSESAASRSDTREIEAPAVLPITATVPQAAATPSSPTPTAKLPPPPASVADGTTAFRRADDMGIGDHTVRVDVGLLDQLMNLVSELVLVRNQVLQHAAHNGDSVLSATSLRLDVLTSELQAAVMKARMQPLSNLFGKLPRLVRDTALACGKQVRVEIEGQATELDRTLLESIKDPLTHLVRNAIDHGIETPHDRVQRGKSPEGRVSVRAFHESSQVNIEISDDGEGVNLDKVRDTALARGFVHSSADAAKLSADELYELLFHPGFSTASTVTNLSGRGVGLDVVRTNVERIGGRVELRSNRGLGTTFILKIPLTLAIIPALIIRDAQQRFAVPQTHILELIRIDPAQNRHAIEMINGSPIFRLRGTLLPLVSLRQEMVGHSGLTGSGGAVIVVVLQAEDRTFGLLVDAVLDTEEIVVKPLGKHLKGLTTIAGATILGDGGVALILDVRGLAQRANLSTGQRARTRDTLGTETLRTETKQPLLLLQGPAGGRMAVPLSLVDRLEQVPVAKIERVAGQEVVQYRGTILPLVNLAHVLPERRKRPRAEAVARSSTDSVQALPIQSPTHPLDDERVPVVVHTEDGRTYGIIVERILDVVSESLDVQRPATRPGVAMSTILQGRVTEVLDLPAIVKQYNAG